MVKYKADITLQNSYSDGAYRSVHVYLVLRPVSWFAKFFCETYYQHFTIKAFTQRDLVEVTESMQTMFSLENYQHKHLSKDFFESAYNKKSSFILKLKSNGFEVPLPYPAIEWLLNKNDGTLYHKCDNFGDTKQKMSYIEVDSPEIPKLDISLNLKKYFYLKKSNNEGELYPFI